MRQSLPRPFPEAPEERRSASILGEHRRRLVEDQDTGVVIERLEDFDPLLFADRETPSRRSGSTSSPKSGGDGETAWRGQRSQIPGPELFRSRA